MRIHPSNILSLCLLLAPFFSTSIAIILSEFQGITGFSAQCTNAYNTPILNCQASDFYVTNPCSTACINGLVIETNLVKTACAGVDVKPTDLIGLIFSGNAIQKLCPNFDVSTTVPINTQGQSSGTSQASSTTPASAAIATVTTTIAAAITTVTTAGSTTTSITSTTIIITSTTISIASTTISTASTTISTASTTISTAVTTISAASTTLGDESTSSTATLLTISSSGSDLTISTTTSLTPAISSAPPTFLKTAVNDGSATVLTSKAEQTASNNPDAFGGGGSPFEISSSSHNTIKKYWIWLSILCWLPVLWLQSRGFHTII